MTLAQKNFKIKYFNNEDIYKNYQRYTKCNSTCFDNIFDLLYFISGHHMICYDDIKIIKTIKKIYANAASTKIKYVPSSLNDNKNTPWNLVVMYINKSKKNNDYQESIDYFEDILDEIENTDHNIGNEDSFLKNEIENTNHNIGNEDNDLINKYIKEFKLDKLYDKYRSNNRVIESKKYHIINDFIDFLKIKNDISKIKKK